MAQQERTTDDQRWRQWCDDFDEVEHEVFTLFHTRWMWRALTGLMANGVPERQYTVVQNYFVRTYVGTVCTAIRREVDPDVRTTSLARCLQTLIDCPHFANKQRFDDLLVKDHPNVQMSVREESLTGFGVFSEPGSDFISPDKVQAALDRLAAAASPIKRYTNKVLAHRERRSGGTRPVTPSFDAINRALETLGDVFAEFYGLRHPGTVLGNLTPAPDLRFVSMFEVPWYTADWIPPPHDDHLTP